MPNAEKHTPPGYVSGVLHAHLELEETAIMASDVPNYEPMRSAYLSLAVGSNEDAERIYALLADGGDVSLRWRRRFCASFWPAQGQIRNELDDHSRATDARSLNERKIHFCVHLSKTRPTADPTQGRGGGFSEKPPRHLHILWI